MTQTLLLLPGLMCDAAVWAPQLPGLAPRARCVVPAWGLCDSLTGMAQQALREAPTERFSLVGHSMGGRVAMEIMRLAPQRVERLALLDTGTHPLPGGEAGAKERAGRMALLELARAQGMRVMGEPWTRGMLHPDRHSGAVFEIILQMVGRSSPAQFAAQINALLNRPDAAPVLQAIQCPTLLLCGREDAWSTPAQHQAMHALLPTATLKIVEHCGHFCTLEQPQVLTETLLGWLQH